MTGLRAHVVLRDRDVDVTIGVGPDECVALVGPNGAGKSSVVEAIAGLVALDAGGIEIDGRTVDGARRPVPPHRRRVGLVAQRPDLFPNLSVARNVGYGPRASGRSGREARIAAQEALAVVDAVGLSSRAPATLSGGQAQRVAIARALAAGPAVLLLDEPTSALDVEARESVRAALGTAIAGRPSILVTHDPIEVVALATRVVVVERGRVVETGTTAEVLGRPTSAFGAAFSGLALVPGTATGTGIALDGGGELASATPTEPPGGAVLAAYHPTAAVVTRDGDGPVRTVRSIEPRDGLVRVRAGELVADVTVAAARRLALASGDAVHLTVPPGEVDVYAPGR
ncbi:molybdate transport system ATP-binding protein [Curtobacterium sp. PhB130]|uniref:ABC transporter ATP-binding protein n=1 Tax=unclassified Curtobacterium TaxID=257496 RepID=UPI000F4BDE84|nr:MULTISPECIES: ABC transporter ATP-binding protein [unclassified Curtobacterium]ROS75832.1 molybdate transport system ATP-binding protein [Curtobacterium sp. PhB130]TCK64433.1 molybdate transport system ATP-binding protein [Curtobacterium sp. PhB136]